MCIAPYIYRNFVSSQLQLGTGKTAVWLVGWLVGGRFVRRVCQSVCPRYRFGHISATGRPIDFVFVMRQRAARPENVCRA